jgi:hypothetical protein
MSTRAIIPVLTRSGSFKDWSVKLEAFLKLQEPQLHSYLHRRPQEGDVNEAALDDKGLSHIQLHTDASLSSVLSSCVHANETYEVLAQQMQAALQIRKSVNNARITKLCQGPRSVNKFLSEAQDLMCEARTIDIPAQMEQLCSQIVAGLRDDIRKSIGDSILFLAEENLTLDSTADEIQTVFNLIVNAYVPDVHNFSQVKWAINQEWTRQQRFQCIHNQLRPYKMISRPG